MNKRLTSLAILLGIAAFLSAACRLATGTAATLPTATITASPAKTSTDTETPAANSASPAAPAIETPVAAIDGQTLLQERCNVCHPLSFIYNSRGTPDQWAQVVSIMINNGAVLSPQEEKTLDAYLAKNFGQ